MTNVLELSDKRRQLLEKLLRSQGMAPAPVREDIPRRKGDRPAPLSFGQQRLWFLHQLEPAGTAYNLSEGVRLRGHLDDAALERALAEVVRRHHALRSVFTLIGGEPRQAVEPAGSFHLPRLHLAGLPAAKREPEAARLASGLAALPFDLAQGPLLRSCLLELGPEDHVLVLILHHIVSDGWSLGLLVRELTLLYDAFAAGGPSPLPEPILQYADFAEWQRHWLQGDVLETQLRFWKERLAGAPTQLALPTDRPWPAVQSTQGAREAVSMGSATVSALRSLAQEQGVTFFMVLVAGLGILLHRLTGQEDLLLGTPAAGRSRPELEGLIGFFINTLVLRINLSEDPDFPALLAQVREMALSTDAHQELPFERLIDDLELPRDLSRNPLFQVMLAFQNLPVVEERPSALALQPFQIATWRSQFELHFSMIESPGGLSGALEYRTQLFDATTARRIVAQLQTLLGELARAPRQRISELTFLAQAERQQILVEWNDTAVDMAVHGTCLHRLIEAQVRRTPDAVAAAFEGERLSYAELNARANRLAHLLRGLGCGTETRVGIAMERSLELVVALLGVLKAGSAYLPLDPGYPTERLAYMLEDSRPTVLLTQEGLLPSLPEVSAPIVCLYPDGRESAELSAESLDGPLDDLQLAYVIYTSGSTGRPKGAMLHHRGIVNRLLWMQDAYRLSAADTVLQKTPFSFDVSVWEFFWPLLAGARIVLAKPGGHRDAAYLARLIAAEQVSVLHFVPSMLQAFVEEPAVGACHSLRLVVASGEALSPELERRFLERLPETRLENLYGPTEASVDVTAWSCGQDGSNSVPIGRPIANTCIYLLDFHLQPVPITTPGELWIAGVNVGRGYLGRPDLTAERFMPDPFAATRGESPGARMYRSGDMARYTAQGVVEYLGRLDQQIKVRGFRIELGEIESVLAQHPAVHQVVVMARDHGASRQKQLVAYVVARSGEKLTVDSLRRFAQDRLPEYMLPASCVTLSALPLSPNGKIDRAKLPLPESGRQESERAYVAPRTPLEGELVEIFAQVLGAPRVGIEDNFFSLGGDSILSIQIVSRARERGIEIDLQQIFQHQTVQGLAQAILAAPKRSQARPRLAAFALISEEERLRLPEDVEDAFPLTSMQAGMLFHSELSPESSVYHNLISAHLQAPFDPVAMRLALDALARRHPILRASFGLTGFREPLQLIHRDASIPLRITDLRTLSQGEQERQLDAWFEEEKRHRFDWKQAPLLRFNVHLRSADRFQLSWSEHHAILDGWSVATVITELMQHYFALIRQDAEAAEPSPPASQFRDYVALERESLADQKTRQFWLGKLQGATAPQLHATPVATAGHVERIETINLILPEETAEGAGLLARRAGLPLKSLALATHLRVLSLFSGQSDLLAAVVTNGRLEETDGESVLGLFVNSLPLRVRLTGGTWTDLARLAFEIEREALPHRRFPIAEMQRLAGGQPLVEIAFTYLHFHVYQSLSSLAGEVRDLGEMRVSIPTNFLLATYFLLDPSTSRLSLVLDYDATRIDAADAERLAGCYTRAFSTLVERPEERYEEALLLPAEERRQVLEAWNPAVPYAGERTCLHKLFEAQARARPEALALVDGPRRWTYGELDDQANRWARHLRDLGARHESLVGLYTGRSLETVLGILAILKAGGAYLPLDPAYPRERLAFMIEDSGVRVVLTTDELEAHLPASDRLSVVRLSAPPPVADGKNLELASHPSSLAYVIYTSGSTGRPKGVLITHQNVTRLFHATAPWFGFSEKDVSTLFHSPAFDFSVWEIWGALLYGGSLVIVPHLVSRSPLDFLALLAAERITVLSQTPSAFRQLAQAVQGSDRELALRQIVFGGEALKFEILRPWFERYGDQARLINMYGITETTVHVTYRPVLQAECQAGQRSLVGEPIPDLQVLVLDSWLQPAPVGTPGELLVAGEGLARGYLGRPALTAQRFVPNPFSPQPGARMYRSGDLARRRPDGDLEYLGRIDTQVKIRGFRIELGEIESALKRHPELRDASVQLWKDANGDPGLVAYVTADLERLAEVQEGAEPPQDQVSDWRSIFDRTYESGQDAPSGFNTTGWISSYTGALIPDEQMQEWVEVSLERIRSLKPTSVLEIGCGTGLLLSRIAPGCARYWATDFSATALAQVERLGLAETHPNLRLLHREAASFEGIPSGSFDLVLLHSIVQYFPSADYLVQVLEGAEASLRDGGCLFVGDVRSLPLLKTFHASIEVERAPATTPIERVRHRMLMRVIEDGELVLAPEFFTSLSGKIPRLRGVRLLLRRGSYANEMTRYRYDALLQVGEGFEAPEPARALSWREQGLDLERVRQELVAGSPPTLAVSAIPNARLSRDILALQLLENLDGSRPLSDLRTALSHAGEQGVHPEDLWRLAEELGYEADISAMGGDGDMEVLFRRRGVPPPWLPPPVSGETAWRAHANQPLVSGALRRLVPRLRESLQRQMPDYMVPASFVLLPELPLTPNGKLDRRALPPPEQERSALAVDYVPPRTDTEHKLVEIWREILHLDRVGIEDNLFEIGGHSLLATQIILRIREVFGVDLPLRLLYESPTVSALAVAVVQRQAELVDAELIETLLAEIESGAAVGSGTFAGGPGENHE